MKILHVCLAGPFSDGFSYQENLLVKYHAKMSHEVFVLTSTWSLNSEGKLFEHPLRSYTDENHVKIERIRLKGVNKFNKKLKRYEDYSKKLNEINPDLVFIHGSQFLDIDPIIAYKKKRGEKVKIVVDNHADFSNSARNIVSRELLHKKIWRSVTLKLEPYVDKFYGVLPARVSFLTEVYGVPKEKVSLLNMGGDDDYIVDLSLKEIRKFKKMVGCKENQLLIVTGGKIDQAKKEILLLMEYVKEKEDLFLVLFGSVEESLYPHVENLMAENIKNIGWINNEDSYKLFAASDLVVFPGRHSVYWEQAVSQKKPMVVKYWEETDHIDIGGNVAFVNFEYPEKEELFKTLDKVIYTNTLNEMAAAAENKVAEKFLYSNIARRSISVQKGSFLCV